MGVDYYSHALIGLKIEKSVLYPKVLKRSCDCVTQEGNFCQKCGKKWLVEAEDIHPEFDEEKLAGYEVVFSTDQEECFVACHNISTDSSRGKPKPQLAQMLLSANGELLDGKSLVFKQEMQRLGLWDENRFGLWSVLYCSY